MTVVILGLVLECFSGGLLIFVSLYVFSTLFATEFGMSPLTSVFTCSEC